MIFRPGNRDRRQVRFGAGVGFHDHQGEDISGGIFSGVTLSGDFYSTLWDGARPADLSTTFDSTAAEGFYFDSSAGRVQFMNKVWVGGYLTLVGSGTLTAGAGSIAGFTINATEGIYAGSGTTRVQMKPGAGFWAGATAQGSAPFRVTQAGALIAAGATLTSATVSGAITATSGTIGGFTLATHLYTGSKTAYNDGLLGVHLGTDGLGIGNDTFRVAADASGTAYLTSAGIALSTGSGKPQLIMDSTTFNFYYGNINLQGNAITGVVGISGTGAQSLAGTTSLSLSSGSGNPQIVMAAASGEFDFYYGNLDMNSARIVGVANPVDGQDVVTRAWGIARWG